MAYAANAAPDIGNSLVKIYTVSCTPSYYNPWNAGSTTMWTGSGAIIKPRRILTNAHVVSDATFIQVRRNGQSRRYTARVENVSHESDLALLAVDDASFFDGTTSLELDDLPALQQEVLVYGFPMGGDVMSITKGVVSRVEHQDYVHSGLPLLAIQIDAPINSGNSGGPAIIGGRIAGVAMMVQPDANSIGYIIPATVVRHFLDDLADGRQDGFPSAGIRLQKMENPALKRRYGLGDRQDGMLVLGVTPGGSAAGVLRAGDVLTGLDGMPVAGDGTVEFRKGERTSWQWVPQGHQMGESVTAAFIRDGKPATAKVKLTGRMSGDRLIPPDRYDVLPTYYVFGGLVFCPLTMNMIKEWGNNWSKDAPPAFMAVLNGANMRTEKVDEVVVLLRVMAGSLNQGYHDANNAIIRKVNGREIRSLREMVDLLETCRDPFVCFEAASGEQLVLDRQRCLAEQPEILKTYQIVRDRSVDLAPTAVQTAAAKPK